jgi:RNA polymerase sigma-70 factor (ECF subfamily)
MSNDEIVDLIEKIQQGGVQRERGAERLFEIFRPVVLSFFSRKGVSPEECRDLTQDVFYRVFKSIDTFRGKVEFKAWLFEIAQNVFFNYLRSRKAEKRSAVVQSISQRGPDDEESPMDLLAPEQDPLDEMIARQWREELASALDDLPDQMRRCCLLRYGQGLKYREIAAELGVSIETVKAHLFQGRKRLTSILRPGS